MKKTTSLLFSLVLVSALAFAGCGKKAEDDKVMEDDKMMEDEKVMEDDKVMEEEGDEVGVQVSLTILPGEDEVAGE